jgi:uncharacterized protein YjdB
LTKGVAGAVAALLLCSCGNFFPSSNSIVAITISPQSFYVLTGGSAQFTAQATFGNNSTGDVTTRVTWASSNTSIATINSSGAATAASSLPSGTKLATTSITAKSGSVTSNTSALTVATVHIQSIAVSPGSQSVSSGQQVQFTATATLTDGTMGVSITNIATWTSSNTAVATVNSSGLATAVSTGTATIQASLDNQSSSGTLTVQ